MRVASFVPVAEPRCTAVSVSRFARSRFSVALAVARLARLNPLHGLLLHALQRPLERRLHSHQLLLRRDQRRAARRELPQLGAQQQRRIACRQLRLQHAIAAVLLAVAPRVDVRAVVGRDDQARLQARLTVESAA